MGQIKDSEGMLDLEYLWEKAEKFDELRANLGDVVDYVE
jgi:hypothetical protein